MTKYPLMRGMLSYSLIWPTSALIQQTIAGKTWGELSIAKHSRIEQSSVQQPFNVRRNTHRLTINFLLLKFELYKTENYDWKKCIRFSLYGSLVVAPTLYCWIRISSKIWPTTSLKTAIYKALLEQASYTPLAMTCFYFGMSILENKTVDEAVNEVKTKFWPTYQVSVSKCLSWYYNLM